MNEKLTWTCHICRKERPDNKISVMSKPLVIDGKTLTDGSTENIRYCNDNDVCREKAKTFSFFKKEEKVRI